MAKARIEPDGTVILIGPDGEEHEVPPRTDWSRVDATGEAEIERHARDDDHDLAMDAAAELRMMRERAGLSEAGFAARIGVPLATLRDWESGRRRPRGPAKALLRVIRRAPETALRALGHDPDKPPSSGTA